MKIGSIVIRCHEFEKMQAFWQAALHYQPKEPSKGGWVILRDPTGQGPNISLDQTPQPHSGKRSKIHLDLYTDDQAEKLSVWSAWVHDGTHGVTQLAQIMWYWKTRMEICFVLCNLNKV